MSLSARLEKLLAADPDERGVHRFLKDFPYIIIHTFNVSWNYYLCVPEFPVGSQYRADFLVLSADSGCWHVVFIELESPRAQLYLGDGTPSRTLRIASRQIEDWVNAFSVEDRELRYRLSRLLAERDVAAQNGWSRGHKKAEAEILDPRTWLRAKYHIVIGRRGRLSPEEQNRRARPGAGYPAPLATYDRLVMTAKEIESNCEESGGDVMKLARRSGSRSSRRTSRPTTAGRSETRSRA